MLHIESNLTQEMSELIKELTADLRGKPDPNGILEELADVTCAVEYLKCTYGISAEELAQAMNVKLDNVNCKIRDSVFM